MDVTAPLAGSSSPPQYPAGPDLAQHVAPSPPADVDASSDAYTPSASPTQVAAAVTVSPSATPSEVVAAVQRLPASVRYAPAAVPRDARLSANFDRSA